MPPERSGFGGEVQTVVVQGKLISCRFFKSFYMRVRRRFMCDTGMMTWPNEQPSAESNRPSWGSCLAMGPR